MTQSPFIPEPMPLSEQTGGSLPTLVRLMQRLLGPDGCPWDRAQTPDSLKQYVLEEACEVMDAIEQGSSSELCDELGDLTLQVVFLAELSRSLHGFGPDDAIRAICEKLVRRHPHVFGDAKAESPEAVAQQWESIKAQERSGDRPLLARVPRALPPLARARKLSERAARVGFDWPDTCGSRDKVSEELEEFDSAVAEGDRAASEAELGDLLFAAVNLARHHQLDAERALKGACERFTERFGYVEQCVQERHGGWPRSGQGKPGPGIPLTQLEQYWQAAKARLSATQRPESK